MCPDDLYPQKGHEKHSEAKKSSNFDKNLQDGKV